MPSRFPAGAGFLTLLALLLFHASRPPPSALPATAADTLFSAARAMVHLREVAQRPRPPGSAEHARVREYLVGELGRLGLEVQVQEVTAFSGGGGTAARVRNVVARLRGSDPDGRAVLLAAHYDGVGGGSAAADDGSGVAALLEVARAVKAGGQPRHDLMLLLTDAEEVALLGAGAFVREHPWARDVAVLLNLEARGVSGRSVMFESSPGNGELVRALAAYGDAETSSFWTPIYRALPNDTDLSRFLELGVPALNFAFVDGLERYHSAEDDTVHLDPRSLQHQGDQALALTRRFAQALPSATRRDAVFFGLPLVGLVHYPEGWNLPLAVLLSGLVIGAGVRVARTERRWLADALLGAGGTLAASLCGVLVTLPLIVVAPTGVAAPGWRGAYAMALALAALAAALALRGLLRRRVEGAAAHLGVVAVWAAIALLLIRFAPGASHLFLWPAAAAAAAMLSATGGGPRLRLGLQALAVVVALSLVVPTVYLLAVVGLGVIEPGAIVIGLLTPLLAWLLAPQLEWLSGQRRRTLPLASAATALMIAAVCVLVPHPAGAVPTKSVLAYALDAGSGQAWLASPGFLSEPGSWAADALAAIGPGNDTTPPEVAHPVWVNRAIGYPYRMNSAAAPAPGQGVEGARVEPLVERATATGRLLTLRVRAPAETLELELRLRGASIHSVNVDGLAVPSFVVGRPRAEWGITYAAPPAEGVLLEVDLEGLGGAPTLEVLARRAGLPPAIATRIPPRPVGVVPGMTGDVTVVRGVFPL